MRAMNAPSTVYKARLCRKGRAALPGAQFAQVACLEMATDAAGCAAAACATATTRGHMPCCCAPLHHPAARPIDPPPGLHPSAVSRAGKSGGGRHA